MPKAMNPNPANVTLVANSESPIYDGQFPQGDRPVAGPTGPYTFAPLNLGAGGLVTGIWAADNGDLLCKTDVAGAYRRYGSRGDNSWVQLCTTERFPNFENGNFNTSNYGGGVYAVRSCATNSNIIWMTWEGNVYKSTNGGDTFAYAGLSVADDFTEGNEQSTRQNSDKIAVDPINGDHVLVGFDSIGVYRTQDGGANWTQIISGGNGRSLVFDRSSGTTSGRTSIAYAARDGQAVQRTTNGGTSWAAVAGAPTGGYSSADVDSQGNYFCTNNDQLFKYDGSSWTTLIGGDENLRGVRIDPNDDNRIAIWDRAGEFRFSTNGGTSFGSKISQYTGDAQIVAQDIDWHAWTTELFMTEGDAIWDPVVPNRMYFAEGIGVFRMDVGAGAPSSFDLLEDALGIEELVGRGVWVPPGSNASIVSCSDRGTFANGSPQNASFFPATHSGEQTLNLQNSQAASSAINNDNFVVHATCKGGNDHCGFSLDQGLTWQQFAAQPPGLAAGGNAVASTDQNILIIGNTGGGEAHYTLNRGASWNAVSLPGTSNDNYFQDGSSGPHSRCVACRDPLIAGKFWIFKKDVGVFVSTDGGASWTQQRSGNFNVAGTDRFHGKLKVTPGISGHVWWAAGDVQPNEPATSADLWRSQDGGVTWTTVPNVDEPKSIGFGTIASGASYPRIFVPAWVGGDYGIWYSDDNAASWTKIATWPVNYWGQHWDIDGWKDGSNGFTCLINQQGAFYGVPS